jgi:tetratricopeptide (TPR) repeat protein
MVSNFYGLCNTSYGEEWPMMSNTVYPRTVEDVLKELRLHPGELTPEILKPFFPDAENLLSDNDEVLRSVMKILAHCSSIHNATTWLMENTEWDCTAVYYDALDHFSHLAMKYHPPKMDGISSRDFKNYHYIVEAAYRFHDMMLDRLLTLAGEDTNVILVSDHGFENGVNRILELPDQPAAPALEHHPYGVLICSGPDFRKDHSIYGASLLDICPTLLQLYNLPTSEDMEGNVLQDVFNNKVALSRIKTYENDEPKKLNTDLSYDADIDTLSHLYDIGYLDKNPTETPEKKVLYENEYNLAQSLIDGGHIRKAVNKLEWLCIQSDDHRYLSLLCKLYLSLQNWKDFEKSLKKLDQVAPNSIETQFLKGQYYLATQQYVKAHEILLPLKEHSNNPALLFAIAKSYFNQGAVLQAKEILSKLIFDAPEIAEAWIVLAKCFHIEKDLEQALNTLLDSLEFQFFHPEAHKMIGTILVEFEDFENAANALELSLSQNDEQMDVVLLLNELYNIKLNAPEKIRTIAVEPPKIVVSGLPRSGTSLTMQLLEAGGLPVLKDESRKADEHNPNGYFELQELTQPERYSDLFKGLNKTVKITYPLVMSLPKQFMYKVIVINRDLQSVVLSQQRMKEKEPQNLDFSLTTGLIQLQQQCETWLQEQMNIEVLHISYEKLLNQPEKEITRIGEFLQQDLNHEEMLNTIDPSLNRSQQ